MEKPVFRPCPMSILMVRNLLPRFLKLFLENLYSINCTVYTRSVVKDQRNIAAIGHILISLVPRKTVVPTPLRMALREISHKWTGSPINLPTGVFSVREPERSSINLIAVDYIRVVQGPPHFTGLYGNLHRESGQNLSVWRGNSALYRP